MLAEHLTPDEIRGLIERDGSLNEAAIRAIEDPRFAHEFERVPVLEHKGQRFPNVPPQFEPAFARLVVAARLQAEDTDSEREPLPFLKVEQAVRRRVLKQESWGEIEDAIGLSHRKVGYIRSALRYQDLGWDLDEDRISLGPLTRNTPAGLILPRR